MRKTQHMDREGIFSSASSFRSGVLPDRDSGGLIVIAPGSSTAALFTQGKGITVMAPEKGR